MGFFGAARFLHVSGAIAYHRLRMPLECPRRMQLVCNRGRAGEGFANGWPVFWRDCRARMRLTEEAATRHRLLDEETRPALTRPITPQRQ